MSVPLWSGVEGYNFGQILRNWTFQSKFTDKTKHFQILVPALKCTALIASILPRSRPMSAELRNTLYILWHFHIFPSNTADSIAHACRYACHYCCTIITVARSSSGEAARVFKEASYTGLKYIVTWIGRVWLSNFSLQMQTYEWQAIAECSD